MRTVRLFVSSPGDVDDERKRVAFVAERLNGEYAGLARFETIRWETKFYTAHDTFQKQIPEAADCDIVIAIFWARLGSELPPDFPRMPDGQPYPSGTAYEVLSALWTRKDDEPEPEPKARHPDVYVFQKKAPPFPAPRDERDLTLIGAQWQQLKGFFERWFVSRDGHFLAAFQAFQTTDEFETQIEKLLRDWLAEHVLAARPVLWPIESRGSPFRGLDVFDSRHAAVFFGRSRDVTRATDRLKAAAASGMPFLLLVGASGSGKSSLARAGLVPRLTTPGVIPAVDAWRVAVMKPGGGTTPIEALAEALFARDEGGGVSALPELAESDYATAHDLAGLMRAGAAAIRPIERALDRVGEAQRARGGFDRALRVDLLLVVDQLDDLFASHVGDEDRAQFAAVLAALLATQRAWVVATLRAALYERFLEEPGLKALKDGGADYDLAPPGPAELADIVRKPAEAAALVFEHSAAGVGLDERLLEDAAGADTLPLLQFTLQRLFEERQTADGEVRLTFAAYEALGGLGGAIDQAAERALAKLGEAEIGALPRLLRQLAVPVRDASSGGPARAALTIRSAPLAEAAPNEPARRLVDALVEARILLSGQQGDAASVRLAHQRVLDSWHRARDIVASNADFFRIREEIEEQRRRWEERDRKSELLLPAGLPLAEAETIVARHGDELDPQTRAFVAASSARAKRRQRLTAAAAAVFAVVAVLASVLGLLAYRAQQRAEAERLRAETERTRAEANYTAAKSAVNRMVFDIAQGLRSVEGMRIETISRVLQTVRGSVDSLAATNPADPGLEWIRMAMLDEFANTYRQAGDRVQALAAVSEAVALLRQLDARHPNDAKTRRGLAIELERLGDIKRDAGDLVGARAAYEEAYGIYRALVDAAPDDNDLQFGLTVILDRLGGLKETAGDLAGARVHFEESLAIGRRLAERQPNNPDRRRFLAVALNKIGAVYQAAGDMAKATEAYSESLAIARDLTRREPDNTQWQSDVLIGLVTIGDLKAAANDNAAAQASYEEALAIARRLAQQDPDNVGWQRQIGLCLDRIGDMKRNSGDATGARATYDEILVISRRLAARDPENVTWQRDITVSLNKIGDLEKARRDFAAAIAAYEESIAIRRRLLARAPESVEAARDLQIALDRLADAKLSALDFAGARAAFEERIALARKVLAKDDANTQWQKDLIFGLIKLTQVADAAAGRAALEEAQRRLEDLDKAGRLDAATQRWLALVRELLKPPPKGDKG